jgi:dTDP-4-amino-4,6-dideoxygalactose transaminase
MIPIAAPLVGEAECDAVVDVLRSGQLVQGSVVETFEQRFAELCDAPYAIATTSGTTALHVAMLAHEIGPGDEVITPSFSFIASANAALYVGARPVFADIDPGTFTIDPDDVERKITPRTRAVIAVHLYGNPAALDRLVDICERHGLILIEDACQAHIATFRDRKIGTFGTGVFSFYPTKNMTSGEGGLITTSDPALAERARLLRAHGMPRRYYHESLGYNFRLSNIHAAIGVVQIEHLHRWTERRRVNAARLSELLAGQPLGFQQTLPGAWHVYHQFTVRIPHHRDAVADYLRAHGVGCEIYYPLAIHEQPLYRQLGYTDHLPHTELATREVLSIPVHPALTISDLSVVAETLTDALMFVAGSAIPIVEQAASTSAA